MQSESLRLVGAFALYGLAGCAYFALIGVAVARWLLPAAWRPFWPLVVLYLGWAAVVTLAYPLNATFPGRPVLLVLAVVAAGSLVTVAIRRGDAPGRDVERTAWVPLALGGATYTAGAAPYVRAGTLTGLVVDSDVEHFADVIAALLAYPIGWALEAQMGLEATPVGLAYHYVHAVLSAVTGTDTYATAVPSHLLMLALAPAGVYVFARDALGCGPRTAALASALYACGGVALGVAAFGWGQQTAALATVPIGLAAVRRALDCGRRELMAVGLLAALAAGSLYLASAPVIGGAALAYAAVRSRSINTIGRTLLLGIIVLAAGALSHLSAAGYFLTRGGLRAEGEAERSSHVNTFASLPAALGATPLDLFADSSILAAWPIVALAAAFALCLIAAGAGAVRHRAFLPCIATVVLVFVLYLRVLRPFPYGEFKLLTTIWFLLPSLAAAGAARLVARRSALRWLASGATVVYAIALLTAQISTRALLAGPWGAALPEREMDALRGAVAAVPLGNAVWVSNQLAPGAAVEWRGAPTSHRAGFSSREAAAGYLAARWRGAATALLAFSGRSAYGNVQRHSTELRAPITPRDADYMLLDESEDPLLFGLVDADLVYAAERLRLFRSATDAPHRRELPAAPLPIGESFPGRRQGYVVSTTPTRPRPAAEPVPTRPLIGVFAAAEVEVEARSAAGTRRLALFPGLTWYAPPDALEQIVALDTPPVRVVARQLVDARRWAHGEALMRSSAGITAPWVALTGDGVGVEIAYVNLTAGLVSTTARLKAADTLWLHGQTASASLTLDPLARLSRASVTGQRRAALWLEIGSDAAPALHAPPVPVGTAAYSLPLLGSPAAPVRLDDGTLVKGSSARLHAVEGGKLRWVPTLEALQRRGPIPRIVTLPDEAVWRLPVALPLE